MYGQSYFGYTQLAATRQPPALKAIIPYMAVGHPMNGWMYRGGAVELGARANWSLMMGLDHLVRRHRGDLANLGPAVAALTGEMDRLGTKGYASVPLAEFEPLRRQAVAPWFFEQLAMREIDDELDAVSCGLVRQRPTRTSSPVWSTSIRMAARTTSPMGSSVPASETRRAAAPKRCSSRVARTSSPSICGTPATCSAPVIAFGCR